MEWNDMYDENRRLTGQVLRRGEPIPPGAFGLVVCVWVYDGHGRLLLTRRAPGKSFAGTWENSGGAAKAGEDSLTAIRRELREETGIEAGEGAFEFLSTTRDAHFFFDHYCLRREIPIGEVVLQPGETDGAKWVTFEEVHAMIGRGEICPVIAAEFLHHEPELKKRQSAQE